jgi:hypothetical protein
MGLTAGSPCDLSRLLCRLHGGHFTGRVQVHHAGLCHRINLRQGLIRGAVVAGVFDPLGHILQGLGKLGPAGLARSLEQMTRTERLQGQLLQEMGLVSALDVEAALRAQLTSRVLRILHIVERGSASISSSPLATGRAVDPAPPLHPLAAVRQHVDRLSDAQVAVLQVTLARQRLRLVQRHTLPRWLLTPQEERLLQRLPSEVSPACLPASATDRIPVLRLLLLLHLTGFLEPAEPTGPRASSGLPDGAVKQPDPARLIGLPPDAPTALVRRAYRRLALELHPDRHPTASAAERAHLAQRFAAATQAYRALLARSR